MRSSERTFLFLMDIFRVTLIGHRDTCLNREEQENLEKLIIQFTEQHTLVDIQIGRNGSFDIQIASLIKKIQRDYLTNNLTLVLVLPYLVKDGEYYEDFYDDVIYPLSGDIHYKAAITKRNEWMIDNSELLIAYVEKDFGGAYNAIRYASKKGVKVINIFANNN